MTYISYKTIVEKAKIIKNGVEKQYKLIGSHKWSYYMAKAILTPNKNIPIISIDDSAPINRGDYISTQIYKKDFIACAKKFVNYVEKNKRLSWTITGWENRKIGLRDYTYMFAKILVWYDTYKELPDYNNINSKAFTKPTEYSQQIYDYFVKKTGKKFKTIDDLLSYVRDNFTYEFYSDDYRSNKQVMDDFAGNCTDLMHWLANMAQVMGYDWKCIHVECRVSGIGHVWGKFRHKVHTENTWINRDPSAVCGNSVRSMWCEDGYFLAQNPSWWMENLKR